MATDKIVNKKSQRQRRSPEAARDNILAAAESILRGAGPHELKLTEVARAAGVATATVLHHFPSISAVQTALMERMVTQLVEKVLHITEASPAGIWDNAADIALFDAFEEQGAARLAAWLVMTGEAGRLEVVRRAVDAIIARIASQHGTQAPARETVEDLILAGITMALGSGLFGQSLCALLGYAPDRARRVALQALAAQAVQAGALPG